MPKYLTSLLVFLSLGMILGSQAANAQDSPNDDLKARIERLEKQNQELLQALQKLQTLPASPGNRTGNSDTSGAPLNRDEVREIVNQYLQKYPQRPDRFQMLPKRWHCSTARLLKSVASASMATRSRSVGGSLIASPRTSVRPAMVIAPTPA